MNRKYRKTVIAGNWKMNKTPTETKAFMTEFKTIMPRGRWCDVALCVPAVCIPAAVRAMRETQLDAGVVQARGKARGADAVEQIHRRHVQRQAQRGGGADRAVERGVEVAGAVAAEALRRIHQQAFGMNEAIVQRHPVQERFERGASQGRVLSDRVDLTLRVVTSGIRRDNLSCRVIYRRQGDLDRSWRISGENSNRCDSRLLLGDR